MSMLPLDAHRRLVRGALAQPPHARVDREQERQNLAAMLRRCAHALGRRGREDLAADVVGLLRRYDLLGSPLRAVDAVAAQMPQPAKLAQPKCGKCEPYRDACRELVLPLCKCRATLAGIPDTDGAAS